MVHHGGRDAEGVGEAHRLVRCAQDEVAPEVLHQLELHARTERAGVHHLGRERVEHRARAVEGRLRATDHRDQAGEFRVGWPAGDPTVDEGDALLRSSLGEVGDRVVRDRAAHTDDQAVVRARHHPVATEEHRFHLGEVEHDDAHHVARAGDLGRAFGTVRAVGLGVAHCIGPHVVHDRRQPRLRDAPRHR